MGTVVLLLFQLWNQPSVRMLGFGDQFVGVIPDPMTDLLLNPAYLKDIGQRYEGTFNSLQLYAFAQEFEESFDSLDPVDIRSWIYSISEPLAVHIFYPKIGFGFRGGIFTRYDERNYLHYEEWLYVQGGLFGALNIGKYVRIGGQWNYSENDQADRYWVRIPDSVDDYNTQIYHNVWSDELGAGFVVGDCQDINWQLSFSIKKNWETNYYEADTLTPWRPWPNDWPSQWEEPREDLLLFARMVGGFRPVQVVMKISYRETQRVRRLYYSQEDSSIIKFATLEPAVGVLYYPREDVIVAATITHSSWDHYGSPTETWAASGAFEKSFGTLLKFRFGNTALLRTDYAHVSGYHSYFAKSELNFGFELKPYDKLSFCWAAQNPLDFSEWFISLSFAL